MTRLEEHAKKLIEGLVQRYRVTSGEEFRLADYEPADTGKYDSSDKEAAQEALQRGVEWLADAQEVLAAQDRWSLLLVFQARDAAGKDSTIKHVMSGVNPQGCHVASFKQPSSEELDHDYLWRYHKQVPGRGQIGIFNRSYYEEVLVARIKKDVLAKQKLPAKLVGPDIWQQRYEDIANFENYLSHNGVRILKFFLNVSAEEQKKRFMKRLENPEKHWKFNPADIADRRLWDEYSNAYADAIRHTASEQAPWHIIPADNKWYMRFVVAAAVVQAIARLELAYPTPTPEQERELEKARAQLENESGC
jgi:PPK2 family polyphosphate:nucleotide phosphotransferase